MELIQKRRFELMAPGYLSLGLGGDYKPKRKFQVNNSSIYPKSYICLDKDLQQKEIFGLKKMENNTLFEFGAYLGARYKLKLWTALPMIIVSDLFRLYEKFWNMDVAYQGILDMKVNKFVSAQVSVNLYMMKIKSKKHR